MVCSPNGSDPDIQTLGIKKERLEDLEEGLDVGLESLDKVLKNSEQDEYGDLSVNDFGGEASLGEERKEAGPLTQTNFDSSDSCDDTGRRMSDKFAGFRMAG